MSKLNFTTETLNQFDANMSSIGYNFEGTLENCVWIYRATASHKLTIQVGDGSIQYVTEYIGNKHNSLSIKGIQSTERLFTWIKSCLGK